MKKSILLSVFLICTFAWGYGQQDLKAKKPSLMVIPNDNWFEQHDYQMEYDNQGTKVVTPDYEKAFRVDTQITPVITMINGIFAKRGFPIDDLSSTLKNLKLSEAKNIARTSTKTKSGTTGTLLDKIKARAKSDIVLDLLWTVLGNGPDRRIEFTLRGLDAYTNKQVASTHGIGAPSASAPVEVLLEEAVLANMDEFCSSLQKHFEDVFANGREMVIELRCWDDWEEDFYSTFGEEGDDLSVLVEDWVAENTQGGVYGTPDTGDRTMIIPAVRMPLFYERKGRKRVQTAESFGHNLQKYLRKYKIDSSVETAGLGKVIIRLGHR